MLGVRMAEGEGFEPSIRFPVYTLSRRAPSATRPPLHAQPLASATWVSRPLRPGNGRNALRWSAERVVYRQIAGECKPLSCGRTGDRPKSRETVRACRVVGNLSG